MRTIGRYEVEAVVGKGAMGVVYAALDPRLGRRVAVKTCALPAGVPPERREEFRARFEREARAAAALSHPSIVTVYDVDHDAGLDAPFIAMEYVEGESLDALLKRRGRLGTDEACAVALQIADALGAAHAAGIVHRDVKPANVLVGKADGRVKLADFGVARLRESELTRSGAALGSPAYMSPEQVRGEDVDARSDLFSLAVILYRMLTGRRPFEADDLPALLYAIAHESPVPAGRHAPDVPWALSRFLDRALAKSAGDRPGDARAFREALLQAMASSEPQPGERTVAAPSPATASARDGRTPDTPTAADVLGRAVATLGPDRSGTRLLDRLRGRRNLAALAIVAAIVAAVALLAGDPAYIAVEGRSTVREGTLILLVDGEEVFRRDLEFAGELGSMHRWMDKVRPASGGETFETLLETSAGRREVEAVLQEAGGGDVHRSSVVLDLGKRETATLKVIAGRSRGAPLALKRD